MNTGIQLALNFDLKAPLPLDQRLSVNVTGELNSIIQPYSGIAVYSADTKKIYYLKSIIDGQKTWVEFPVIDQLVKNYGNEIISGTKTFSSRPNVNGNQVLVVGDITLGDVIGIPNFPTNAVYNDNLLMSAAPSGYLTGVGYTGNYDGGYFFGRTKITQNTTRIVETGIGDNFIPVTGTSVVNGTSFSGAWRWLSCSSDAKYITASRDMNYLYSSNDFGKTWYPTAKNIGARNWRGTSMSADGKYQTAVSTSALSQPPTGTLAVSNDYGTSWVTKYEGPNDWVTPAISSDGKYQTVIYSNNSASTVSIYRSNDYGENFSIVGSIANSIVLASLRFIAMSSDGKYQTITATNYILASSDYGVTWRQAYVSTGNTPFFSISMTTNGRFQIVSTSGGQVYVSNDYGYTWKMVKDFGPNIGLTSIANSDHGRLLVMSMKNGFIFTSNDYGNNWKVKTTKLNNTTTLTSSISDTTTTSINVTSSTGMATTTGGGSNFLLIDNEVFYITAINGNALTVTRAYAGTAASTHANGATVILSNDWRRTAISNDGKTLLACDNNYGDPATNTKGGYIYISMTDEKVDGNFYADNLVYTAGDQTIYGIKTFNNTPKVLIAGNSKSLALASDIPTSYVDLSTAQTISGIKTFSDDLNISGDLTLNGGLYINDIEELNLIGANIYADNLVYNTGVQAIAGIKNFSSRPQYNGVDLATTGEAAGAAITDYVKLTTDQTIAGTKTFSSTIAGSINGNAGTVTNGVYTAGDQTIGGIKTFNNTPKVLVNQNSKSLALKDDVVDLTTPQTVAGTKTFSNGIISSVGVTGTNLVYNAGDQTIAGTKTFSSTIAGSINGNAATVTNGVYTAGDQTIAGTKTFSSAPTFSAGASFNGNKIANAIPETISLTATTLTLDATTHNGKIILANSSSAITITIPSSLTAGFNVSVIQQGAGQVTISPGASATLSSFNNQYKTAGQYAALSILGLGTSAFIMYGNTA